MIIITLKDLIDIGWVIILLIIICGSIMTNCWRKRREERKKEKERIKKLSKQRDYYKEIDDVLTSYEYYESHHPHDIDWAANRIDWCWKWRKITKEQMEELADRATKIFEEGIF